MKVDEGEAARLTAAEDQRLDVLYPDRPKALQVLKVFRGRVIGVRDNPDATGDVRDRLVKALQEADDRAALHEYGAATEAAGKAESDLDGEEKRLKQLAIDRQKFQDALLKFNNRLNPVLNDPEAPAAAVNKLQGDRDGIELEADTTGKYVEAIGKLGGLDADLKAAELEVRAKAVLRVDADRYYEILNQMYSDQEKGLYDGLSKDWAELGKQIKLGQWDEAVKFGKAALKTITTYEKKIANSQQALAIKNALPQKASKAAQAAANQSKLEDDAAILYGNQQFGGGLLQTIWSAAKAARTSEPANGSIGGDHNVDTITGLFGGWRVADSGVLSGFHIPGNAPQCKWEKDFSRPEIQANFCCYWRTRKINIHVNIEIGSYFARYSNQVDWTKVPLHVAQKYRK